MLGEFIEQPFIWLRYLRQGPRSISRRKVRRRREGLVKITLPVAPLGLLAITIRALGPCASVSRPCERSGADSARMIQWVRRWKGLLHDHHATTTTATEARVDHVVQHRPERVGEAHEEELARPSRLRQKAGPRRGLRPPRVGPRLLVPNLNQLRRVRPLARSATPAPHLREV
jgi:hypothetical protein